MAQVPAGGVRSSHHRTHGAGRDLLRSADDVSCSDLEFELGPAVDRRAVPVTTYVFVSKNHEALQQ